MFFWQPAYAAWDRSGHRSYPDMRIVAQSVPSSNGFPAFLIYTGLAIFAADRSSTYRDTIYGADCISRPSMHRCINPTTSVGFSASSWVGLALTLTLFTNSLFSSGLSMPRSFLSFQSSTSRAFSHVSSFLQQPSPFWSIGGSSLLCVFWRMFMELLQQRVLGSVRTERMESSIRRFVSDVVFWCFGNA
ncbi:hypothetical protein BU26DRAFT_33212 [Trematosphaeria pertusa]|uniref:Uncharacterized protein n=1 Tax=Trematosphaeria pertusa TaxID=390896 RepID=A0A6A6J669_9PLEO|nr:uncharacterized protein BU26DRAFT_33212 [Trematosphaeria pertusa]KAF2256983.1 hypothetical protein BU26DRAFT_33212 [Trematosphaeria pertusa]